MILGGILRLCHLLQTSDVPTIYQPLGDSGTYLAWAKRIAGGEWYGTETFYQAPLYPYFLALVIALGGPSVFWIRLIQALLGAFNAALLGGATRRLFDARAGVAAALMMTLYGPAIYYDGILQKAALSLFLLSALIYLLAVMVDRPSSRSNRTTILLAAATGATLGLLCLTRENALLWIPLIPPWLWWIHRGEARTGPWAAVGGYCVGLVLVLLPVAARNASLGGEWSPTTFQSGPNFYIGNNLEATGVYKPLVVGHESPEFERADAQALAESFVGRELSAREVSRFWMTRSLMEIQQQPGQWLLLMGRKLLMTVNHYEVPDVESPYVHRYWSTPLQVLLTPWSFGVLFPLAAVGLYMARAHLRRHWIFPLLTLSMAAAVAAFFILGRYRLPLAALLIPFAAYAVTNFLRAVQTRRERITAVAVFAASLLIAYLPVHDVRGHTAAAHMNTGIAFGKDGDARQSVDWIRRSLAIDGETAVGLYNLAGAQLLNEQPEAALESLLRARQLDPSFLEVELQLGRLFERRGDRERAAVHYRAALAIDPSNPQAASRLARVLQEP